MPKVSVTLVDQDLSGKTRSSSNKYTTFDDAHKLESKLASHVATQPYLNNIYIYKQEISMDTDRNGGVAILR